MFALPVIAADCAGIELDVTARVCAVLLPQALSAVTIMFPLPVPVVALMLLVVDVPVHPEGIVHVYDIAPLTVATE